MQNMSIDYIFYKAKNTGSYMSTNMELEDRSRHRIMTFTKKLDILVSFKDANLLNMCSLM